MICIPSSGEETQDTTTATAPPSTFALRLLICSIEPFRAKNELLSGGFVHRLADRREPRGTALWIWTFRDEEPRRDGGMGTKYLGCRNSMNRITTFVLLITKCCRGFALRQH